jgi:predicted phosphodiesterase
VGQIGYSGNPYDYDNFICRNNTIPKMTKNKFIRPIPVSVKEVKLPKVQKLTKVITLADLHIPNEINLDGIYEFLEDEKPDYLILLGDFMDIESLSHWSENKRLTMEGKRYRKECDTARQTLDLLRSYAGKQCQIIFLEGNHCAWVGDYIEQHPEMKGIIDLPIMLDLDKRNIKWIPYRSDENFFKIGKLYFTHGDTCTKYHAHKLVYDWNCNIRYGHVHSVQTYTKPSKRGIGDLHRAMSLPCLCKPQFDYIRGKITSWDNGFHLAYVQENGNFWEYVISIVGGKFHFNDKTYG